jgi:hypothetical protein
MRHFLIAGILVLASTVDSSARTQTQTLEAEPIKQITLIRASFGDAIALIAEDAGVTIEFDVTVTEDVRRAQLAQPTIRLANIRVEDAIATLTSMNGLTYTIIGPKAVRISKRA